MCNKKYKYTRENGKKIRAHRLLMQEHLGRELYPNEFVYFINQDPKDLRIENLIVLKKNIRRM